MKHRPLIALAAGFAVAAISALSLPAALATGTYTAPTIVIATPLTCSAVLAQPASSTDTPATTLLRSKCALMYPWLVPVRPADPNLPPTDTTTTDKCPKVTYKTPCWTKDWDLKLKGLC